MSEPNNLLRVDRISLQNFRCFADCSLELHPTLTVLVAENGLGKTSLLDALRIALNVFVSTMLRSKQCSGFEQTDIHLALGPERSMEPQLPTQFTAEGCVDGEAVSWSRVLRTGGRHARSSTKDTKAMRAAAQRLTDRSYVPENTPSAPPTVLPIVEFYGTGRLYDELRLTRGKRWHASDSPVRVSAYLDCLSPSSSYKSFSTWYEQTAEAVRDPRFKALGRDESPVNYLTAVRDAVRIILEPTGWTLIDWEFAPKDETGQSQGRGFVVVEHAENGRLPLGHLSDGVRNMVALVADLTHRCVRLNPHLGGEAARLTPGILMIDEVEMHLHPRWQQRVIGLLQTAFPRMQLILSTHSPQVITTVNRESIRILTKDAGGVWSASPPDEEIKGAESSTALISVMGVNPIPDVPEAQWLRDYTALIEDGDHDSQEGNLLRAKLIGLYGESHSVILDCDRLIRFQAFKHRKQPRTEE